MSRRDPDAETHEQLDPRRDAETLEGEVGDESVGLGPPGLASLADRFEVHAELGRGGMGVVYRARDVAADREVALKVRGGELAPEQRERFLREGEIAAQLDHPGIVRVHSSGVEGGRPYLVYELVEGATAFDPFGGAARELLLDGLRDAALALGHAHARGVIHRDVKPANLLIDRRGRMRVTDFGLALTRSLERMTRSGVLMGTPAYMSPEQVAGRREEIGPASDVWALGVLLYEVLCGASPFDRGSIAETIAAIERADPAPPSRSASVPPGLEALCLRCLERDPRGRPADGLAFAGELEEARSARAYRPRHGWVIAAVCAVPVLALVLVLASVQRPTPEHEAPVAVDPRPTPPPPLAALRAAPPLQRLSRTEAWLREHAGSPHVGAVRDLRDALLEAPILRYSHPQLLGAVLRGERVLSWGEDATLRVWRLDGAEPRVSALEAIPEHLTADADGELVLYTNGARLFQADAKGKTLRSWRLKAPPTCLTISTDGKAAAVGFELEQVVVVDLVAGTISSRLPRHPDRVGALAFSPDGKLLYTGCGFMVREFPVFGVGRLRRFGLPAECTALRMHPLGLLAAGDAQGRVTVWKVHARDPAAIQIPEGRAHSGPVLGLEFSHDGRRLASVAGRWERGHRGKRETRSELHLRSVEPSEQLGVLSAGGIEALGGVGLSLDAALVLAVRPQQEVVELWHARSLSEGPPIAQDPARDLQAIRRIPDRLQQLDAAEDWLDLHGVDHPRAVQVEALLAALLSKPLLVVEHSGIGGFRFLSPRLLGTWNGREVIPWDLHSGAALGSWPIPGRISVVAAHRGRRRCAVGTEEAGVTLRLLNPTLRPHVLPIEAGVKCLAISPLGSLLAVGRRDGFVDLFDLDPDSDFGDQVFHPTSSKPVRRLGPNPGWAQKLVFLDEARVVVGSGRSSLNDRSAITLYDVASGRELWSTQLLGRPMALALAPGHEEILVAGSVGSLQAFDLATGQRARAFEAGRDGVSMRIMHRLAHGDSVGALAVVGGRVFSGSRGLVEDPAVDRPGTNDLRLWELESGRLLHVFRAGSRGRYLDAQVSPDGRLFGFCDTERHVVEVWPTASLTRGGFR